MCDLKETDYSDLCCSLKPIAGVGGGGGGFASNLFCAAKSEGKNKVYSKPTATKYILHKVFFSVIYSFTLRSHEIEEKDGGEGGFDADDACGCAVLLPFRPNTLTGKMAVENSSESQDEKELLIQKGLQQESDAVTESIKPKESKLTLYHWTQSFNSQKVSATSFQHHSQWTAPQLKGIH